LLNKGISVFEQGSYFVSDQRIRRNVTVKK
jgi:hypothetical protein